VQRGYFLANADATINHLGCTFEDVGVFTYGGAAGTVTGCVFRRADQVKPGGAAVTSTLFEASNDSTGAMLITSPAEMAATSGCDFKGNAIAIKITAAGTYTFDGHQFTGNTDQVDFTGTGTCTINPTNGCNVSQGGCTASGGGTIVVNAVQIQLSFTVSPAITGYEWRIYEEDPDPGVIGSTELAGEETASSSSQSYSYVTGDAGTDVVIQIIAAGYEESLTYLTLGAVGQSRNITLTPEENA
jgi:hypothetical protein